jgi:hypothetical protein
MKSLTAAGAAILLIVIGIVLMWRGVQSDRVKEIQADRLRIQQAVRNLEDPFPLEKASMVFAGRDINVLRVCDNGNIVYIGWGRREVHPTLFVLPGGCE